MRLNHKLCDTVDCVAVDRRSDLASMNFCGAVWSQSRGMERCAPILFVILLLCSLHSVVAMALKRILVTGGNKVSQSSAKSATSLSLTLTPSGRTKGIGKAICQQLVGEWKDTHVVLCSRDAARGDAAIADIVQAVGGDSKDRLELMILDTSSDASVKEAAGQFKGELYGIINNAGVR